MGSERGEEQGMVSGVGTFTFSGVFSSNDFLKLSRGYRHHHYLLHRATFSHIVFRLF